MRGITRSLPPLACLLAAALIAASLTGSPALAKCGKDCKTLIRTDFKTCKTGCAKLSAGKACRKACRDERKGDVAACRAATKPSPPFCGENFPPCRTTGAACGSCTGGGTCYELCAPPCALAC